MTTDAALRQLLDRYRAAARDAEEQGDAELAAIATRRRDTLVRLVSHRYHLARRQREAAERQHGPRRVRDHY